MHLEARAGVTARVTGAVCAFARCAWSEQLGQLGPRRFQSVYGAWPPRGDLGIGAAYLEPAVGV